MRTFAQKQNQPQKRVSSNLVRSNMATSGPNYHTHPILHLQRTIGNQAVQRMLQTNAEELNAELTGRALPRFGHDFSRISIHPPAAGAIQAKLAINKPDDYFEKEADRVVDDVMRISGGTPDSSITKGPGPQSPFLTRQKQPHRNTLEGIEDQPVPEDIGLEVSPQTESEVRKAAGGGAPMPESLRDFFEPRFGHNFSHVRIHTDQMAASAAQSLQAVAFTFGSDIFFNSGQYRIDTGSGFGLLAHELAHVIQQQAGGVSRRLIQRAVIPYRQITWADFLATPPPVLHPPRKGRGYSPDST